MPPDVAPRNSDDYLATLLAAGPGLLPAAVMYALAGPPQELAALGRIVTAYPVVFLVSLPGLPVLGYGLARGTLDEPGGLRLRPGWWLAAAVGSLWHGAMWELGVWIAARLNPLAPPITPLPWLELLRYAATIWISAAVCWILYRRRRAAASTASSA